FESEMEIHRMKSMTTEEEDLGSEEDSEEDIDDAENDSQTKKESEHSVEESDAESEDTDGNSNTGDDIQTEKKKKDFAKVIQRNPRERVQKEVTKSLKKQMKGTKSSRNTIKSREKRKIKEAMNDW